MEWWDNRKVIEEDNGFKSQRYTAQEIIEGYDLDLCGFPQVEEIILEPQELIANYQEERARLNAEIDSILVEIQEMLGEK